MLLRNLNLHQAPSRQKRHEVGNGIGAKGRWRQSLTYFTFLVHFGMRLYQPYYSMTMHSCGEALRWTWSLELLQHLCLSKVPVDRQSPQHVAPFAQVAHACRQAGTRSSALSALKILQTARRLSAATSVLHVKVMGACSRSGDWASALTVLEQVGVDGVRPNLRTYTAALTASGIQLSWESAAFFLDSIRSSELHPAEETFDRVLETCRKVSSWAPALAYLRFMRRSHLMPDAIRFASAARALLNKNKIDEALAVLAEMRQCNLDVDVSARIVFTAGMGASADSMAWNRAVHLLCQFNAVGFQADVQLLCATASACRRANNWRDVLYLLGLGGIELDITAHNVAVSSCTCVLQWQWASNLLSCSQQAALQLDKFTLPSWMGLTSRSQVCGPQKDSGRFDIHQAASSWVGRSAWSRAAMLQSPGCRTDKRLCHAAVKFYEKTRRWKQAIGVLCDMHMFGLHPDIATLNAVFVACGQSRLWCTALDLMRQMPQLIVQKDMVSYDALVTVQGRETFWQGVVQLLLHSRLRPDRALLGRSIQILARADKPEMARALSTSGSIS